MVPVLAFTGCGGDGGDNKQPAHLGQEFVLPYGDTADVGPLTLRFVAVTEESRCPLNASCLAFWPGNARIQLAASSPGHSEILELNTGVAPGFAMFDGHVIELVSLDPLPSYPYPAPSPNSYRATLVVDRPVTAN